MIGKEFRAFSNYWKPFRGRCLVKQLRQLLTIHEGDNLDNLGQLFEGAGGRFSPAEGGEWDCGMRAGGGTHAEGAEGDLGRKCALSLAAFCQSQ